MLSKIVDRIKCLFGVHDWLLVSGSQKQTGYAIPYGYSPVHELQEDEVCACCNLHRTRFGLVPNSLHRMSEPEKFKMNENGWPIDRNGGKLPSYLKSKGTSSWQQPPKKHGKFNGDEELIRRIF